MAIANTYRPYGKIFKGQTIPYGTLVGASEELRLTYYTYGYKEDSMLPELPCPPTEYQECVSPEEELFKKEMVGVVGEVLGSLTPREAKVLFVRFGIGLPQDYTLEEVGVMFGVTKERVRQIESKALRKLRHPSRVDVLKELIGIFKTPAEKKAEAESILALFEKERERVEKQRKAVRGERNVSSALKRREYDQQRRQFQQQAMEQAMERVRSEDQRLRAKWDEIEPMVADTDWVKHLETTKPEMYQELKDIVKDIWGYNANKVWEMYAKK
jgi:RNA polymerase sigma factor (sigma-70 family)